MGFQDIRNEGFVSEEFLIDLDGIKGPFTVSGCWRFSNPWEDTEVTQYYRCLDLLLNIVPPSDVNASSPRNATGTGLETIVRACCAGQAPTSSFEATLKVVLVPHNGYLCRSDILDIRMQHSEHADSVIRLSTSGSHHSSVPDEGVNTLLDLLALSPGALLGKKSEASYIDTLRGIDDDLKNRLSFDWVLATPPPSRTVAVVGGRPAFDMKRGSYGSQGPFEAAQGLGISVIVLDRSGHWLEGDTYAYLRDDFIAIDVTKEAELPSNIAKSLSGRAIDGIVTFSDEYVIATAKAAELMGLPTEPVRAILQAHYKDETRKLVNNPNVQALRLESAAQLDDASTAERLATLRYPLIVKPCRGGASRGVKKVHDQDSMRQAIQAMEEEGFAKHGVLLETYVDGPEVDANFVLWDGELLFCEISDDFPCQADASDATLADNFAETLMFLPSRLPAREIEVLRSSLHRSLLQLGFRTGVYHVEARVQNSSMCYKEIDGVLDLVDSGAPMEGQPDAFLIEVNARPPGLACVFSTLYTYGVDFCGLQFLQALGDRERYAALSKPFANLAQYGCGNCKIPVHRENILVPDGFFEKLFKILPDVAPHVSRAELLRQPGDIVSPSGGAGFIGYVLLYSRTSRRHVLEMSDRIRQVSKQILDTL
ncbi:hypothetical protein JX266_012571 [Neoarthrinium moseri]|nr:hypothetical protein JX266_012571 [Neoarthrinium moseri]